MISRCWLGLQFSSEAQGVLPRSLVIDKIYFQRNVDPDLYFPANDYLGIVSDPGEYLHSFMAPVGSSLHKCLLPPSPTRAHLFDLLCNHLEKILLFCIILFIYLLAVLGLCCCVQAFSSLVSGGCSLVGVPGFSLWWLLLLQSTGCRVHRLQQTQHGVVVRGLSCPIAYGTFWDQGLNPCPLHWQVDS